MCVCVCVFKQYAVSFCIRCTYVCAYAYFIYTRCKEKPCKKVGKMTHVPMHVEKCVHRLMHIRTCTDEQPQVPLYGKSKQILFNNIHKYTFQDRSKGCTCTYTHA